MNRQHTVLLHDPGNRPGNRPDNRVTAATFALGSALPATGPLISCLMVSRGRRFPAEHAIRCWRMQRYANRELVIVCATGETGVERLVAELGDPAIRYLAVAPASLGELRNITVAHARGEFLCQWDDDDLSAPDRIALSLALIDKAEAEACFLKQVMLWWPAARRIGPSKVRLWENSLFARRGALPIYPAAALREDTAVARMLLDSSRVALIEAPEHYFYVYHGANSWDEPHFATLFAAAGLRGETPDYAARIAAHDPVLGLSAYARGLAEA